MAMFKITTPSKKGCEYGAGDVQFANGIGYTKDPWVASWHKQHGYTVAEVKGTEAENRKKDAEEAAEAERR